MEYLKNLKIIVTAAASGLGSELAKSLQQSGAKVIICDNNPDELEIFSKNNPDIDSYEVDVSNEDQVITFFKEIKRKNKKIDALINNAGISGSSAKLEDIDFSDWKKTLDVNLNGTFLITKLAVPLLRKNKGGSIINMGSTSSFLGNP